MHRYALYRRCKSQSSTPSKHGMFVFPSQKSHETCHDQLPDTKRADLLQCQVDPAKNLVKGPRKHVDTFTVSKVFVIIVSLFLEIVLVMSITSIDSSMLVNTIGTLMHLPNTTVYGTESIGIAPACRIYSDLSQEDEMARAFVGLRLTPEPMFVQGLPSSAILPW